MHWSNMDGRRDWIMKRYTGRVGRAQVCPKCHKKIETFPLARGLSPDEKHALELQELVCIKKNGGYDRSTARHRNCEGFTIWRNPLNWTPYSGHKFTVDISEDVNYMEIEFEILQTINEEWASKEIAKIAMLDVTPDIEGLLRWHGHNVEWCALDCLRLRLENAESKIYRHILLDLVKQIADEASIDDIKLSAKEILK